MKSILKVVAFGAMIGIGSIVIAEAGQGKKMTGAELDKVVAGRAEPKPGFGVGTAGTAGATGPFVTATPPSGVAPASGKSTATSAK